MSTTTTRPATGHLMSLPGQQHVAEGPLDLNGMYMAHHAFRRDLARFAVAARQTPVEDVEVWRALAIRWEQFGSVLHHHQTTEDDVLWPAAAGHRRRRGPGDARGDGGRAHGHRPDAGRLRGRLRRDGPGARTPRPASGWPPAPRPPATPCPTTWVTRSGGAAAGAGAAVGRGLAEGREGRRLAARALKDLVVPGDRGSPTDSQPRSSRPSVRMLGRRPSKWLLAMHPRRATPVRPAKRIRPILLGRERSARRPGRRR